MSLFNLFSSRPRRNTRARRVTLQCEALESRQLLSGGPLQVTLTEFDANHQVVGQPVTIVDNGPLDTSSFIGAINYSSGPSTFRDFNVNNLTVFSNRTTPPTTQAILTQTAIVSRTTTTNGTCTLQIIVQDLNFLNPTFDNFLGNSVSTSFTNSPANAATTTFQSTYTSGTTPPISTSPLTFTSTGINPDGGSGSSQTPLNEPAPFNLQTVDTIAVAPNTASSQKTVQVTATTTVLGTNAPASPIIGTIASPSTATVGTILQDSADLTGGIDPTGSITFRLYAPGVDPTVGPPTYTETVAGVNGNGTYHTSIGFASNATGIWHWVATYNGDANNNPVSSGPLDEPVTIIPLQADVSVTKQVNQTNPVVGTPVTYTLIAHNNGPDTATGVVVTDLLPAGEEAFISATPSQGSFNPGSGEWIIGTLLNGASATLQLTVLAAAVGPINNTATEAAQVPDPDPANNESTVTIDGMFAPGQISKRIFLSSNDPPVNPATLAVEEALFNAVVPLWVNLWDAMLSEAQSMLAAGSDPGPGNGGIPLFQGNWFGSPLAVYANPLAGQVTAVRIGKFDFLYENNTVASVGLL